MTRISTIAALAVGASLVSQVALAAPAAAVDMRIDPQVRAVLVHAVTRDHGPGRHGRAIIGGGQQHAPMPPQRMPDDPFAEMILG